MNHRNIFMKGRPVHLIGAQLKEGEKAPSFTLINTVMEPVKSENFAGKIVVLSCVPSLDTPTCDLETRRFNQEAVSFGNQAVVITVSKDLPFAQARWCAANGIENVLTLSDYKNEGFSSDYGVLMEETGLLARAVFIIDKEGIIRYIQFVEEVSKEPDYRAVLDKVKELMKKGESL